MFAKTLLILVAGYAGLGVLVGAWHLWIDAPRRNAALRGSPRSVRLLLWPGAAAVWPLLFRARSTAGDHP